MRRDLRGRYQAATETSDTLMCAYDEVARDVVLEVAVPKCLSVVCSLDDPSTGVSHECRDIPYQGRCVATCTEGYEADGSISTTSLRCLSLGEFVSDAQTVSPSCSQMLCSDTLTQSGVGVSSSCGGAPIGDTCMVFCAEGYQAVSNDTLTLTCTCNSSDNTVDWEGEVPLCLVVTCDVIASLRVDFSECFSLTYYETCVVRCSVGYTGVGDKNIPEFTSDSDGHFQGPLECAEESLEVSTVRTLAQRVLPSTITSSRQTVTCQELRCKRERPALCGKRVGLGNHQGSGGPNDSATSSSVSPNSACMTTSN